MSVHWGYDQSNGPHTWIKRYPIVAGTRQSPVNITTTASIHDDKLAANPISISYQPETNTMVLNNGHSIQANINANSVITGGPLSGTYRLQQFHLHWGATNDVGSEHTIDGTCSSAELHLVHYNRTRYGSFRAAVDKSDGLAVFGVMVKIGKEHAGFKRITDVTGKVRQKGQSTQLSQTFNPACLLPDDTSSYWTYRGSLTTPPLHESVTWIVFSMPINISREQVHDDGSLNRKCTFDKCNRYIGQSEYKEVSVYPGPSTSYCYLLIFQQIEALRSLQNEKIGGKPIVNNYRPPLPLGKRTIRCSYPRET